MTNDEGRGTNSSQTLEGEYMEEWGGWERWEVMGAVGGNGSGGRDER